jgi:BirA family transcriptional regulator, biotin operon repressor / biotin---[acetyl-CoA-carboxylase] ligase
MNDRAALRPPLDPRRLSEKAGDWRVEIMTEAPSTNALVAERARAGEQPGLVVVVEHQTAGRGRLDRAWQVPPRAALTFSMLVDPQIPASSWPLLPLFTGYVVETSIADRVPHVTLKWPNDVLAATPDGWGRKLTGILVERVETPTGPMAVVGIGINVSQGRDELPREDATSLRLEVEAEIAAEQDEERSADDPQETVVVDRTELLVTLLDNWAALSPLLGQPEVLLGAYRSVCGTLGQEVDVHLPGGRVHRGLALDLDSSGALVVADSGAQGAGTLTVTAGDVVHVRPAG